MCSQRGRSRMKYEFMQEVFHSIEIWVQENGGDHDHDPPPFITRLLSLPRRQFPFSAWTGRRHRPRIHARFVVVILHTATKPDRPLHVLHCVATLLSYENRLSDRIIPCNASSSLGPFLVNVHHNIMVQKDTPRSFFAYISICAQKASRLTRASATSTRVREKREGNVYLSLTGKLKLEPCRELSLHW
jgi:hypothetical protein